MGRKGCFYFCWYVVGIEWLVVWYVIGLGIVWVCVVVDVVVCWCGISCWSGYCGLFEVEDFVGWDFDWIEEGWGVD